MNQIIQQGVGEYAPLLSVSEPLTKSYADKHGWNYWPCRRSLSKAPSWLPIKRPSWYSKEWSVDSKFLLPQGVGENGLFLMFDADVLVLGADDIRNDIGDADFAAVQNADGEFNLGVYVIRDNEKCKEFLVQLLRDLNGEFQRTGVIWCEQNLLNRKLPRSGLKVKALHRRWNDYRYAKGPVLKPSEIQIKGFHDLEQSPRQKLIGMNSYLERMAC